MISVYELVKTDIFKNFFTGIASFILKYLLFFTTLPEPLFTILAH